MPSETPTATTIPSGTPAPSATPTEVHCIEGCGSGYWKQEQHFRAWLPTGYRPDDRIGSTFSSAELYELEEDTLLQALNFPGGDGSQEKAQILLRAAVAALLNASHPDIHYAPSWTLDVITVGVNAALASGNPEAMLALKDTLESLNNTHCPLN